MADKSYIGKGTIYMGTSADLLISVGNCSKLTIGATEEEQTLKDYQNAGGGDANVLKRIDSAEVNITAHDFNVRNIAQAFFGGTDAVTAGAVSGEAQTTPSDVSADFLLTTDFMIDTDIAVTEATYTEGTDFEVTSGGLIILASGTIPASTALAISYTKKAVDVVELLVNAGQEYVARFVGLNEAQSGTPVVVDLWRVKFGPTQAWDLIGDEFGAIELAGKLLKDSSITTAGLSQYAKVSQA